MQAPDHQLWGIDRHCRLVYESVSGGGGVVHEDDRIQAGFVVDKDCLSFVHILHLLKKMSIELNALKRFICIVRISNLGWSFFGLKSSVRHTISQSLVDQFVRKLVHF